MPAKRKSTKAPGGKAPSRLARTVGGLSLAAFVAFVSHVTGTLERVIGWFMGDGATQQNSINSTNNQGTIQQIEIGGSNNRSVIGNSNVIDQSQGKKTIIQSNSPGARALMLDAPNNTGTINISQGDLHVTNAPLPGTNVFVPFSDELSGIIRTNFMVLRAVQSVSDEHLRVKFCASEGLPLALQTASMFAELAREAELVADAAWTMTSDPRILTNTAPIVLFYPASLREPAIAFGHAISPVLGDSGQKITINRVLSGLDFPEIRVWLLREPRFSTNGQLLFPERP